MVEVVQGDYQIDMRRREIFIPKMKLRKTLPNLDMLVEKRGIAKALGHISEYALRYSFRTITTRLNELNALLEVLRKKFGSKAILDRNTREHEPLQQLIEKITKEEKSHRRPSTNAEWIKNLNLILGELASCGVIREFQPIAVPRGSRKNTKHRPDLVALHPQLAVGASNATAGVDAAAKQYLVYANSLENLRRALEDEYLTAKRKFDEGMALLGLASPNIVDRFKSALKMGGRRATREFSEIFPAEDKKQQLANLLKIYRDHYFLKPNRRIKGVFNAYLQGLINSFGGATELCDYITYSAQTITAVVTILLIDRNVNPSVALGLLNNYESPTDDTNVVVIHAIKLRVGPEEIPLSLPLYEEGRKVTVAVGLREIFAANQWVRDTHPEVAHSLFAYMSHIGPSTLKFETFAKYLDILGKKHGFDRLRSSSIRPTGAVRSLGEGDLHSVAQQLQQANGSTSTAGYLSGAGFMLVSRMRDFQENFQIGIVGEMPDVLRSLGYTPSQAKVAKERAKRTGLGFYCRDPNEAPLRASNEGHCQEVGKCSTCKIKLFVADPLSIAEQIAIDRIISRRMDELSCEDPVRWESTWVNMLAFAKTVVSKIKSSYFSKHLRAAEKLADELIERGYDPTGVKP